MGISGGAVHAAIVGCALLILSLAVLRKVEPHSRDHAVARLVRWALVLKLIAAPLQLYFVNRVYENVADYNLYHAMGAELAAPYRGGDFQVELPHKIIGLGIIYIVTGLVYAVIGVSKTGGALVFSCIGFWGLYLFYRAARVAVPEVDTSRYATVLFLLPSMLFWSSTIGKDALMCFALGLSALGAARVLTRRRLGFVTLAAGLAVTALIRPHVTLMFVLAMGIAYVVRPTSGRSVVEPLLKVLGIAVLVVGGVALGNQVEEYLGIPDLRPETIGAALDQTALETGEESPFGGENDAGYGSSFDSDGLRSPLALPGALVTVLFRPFPFEAHNGPSLLASLEGAVLLGLVLTSLGRFRYAMSVWRRRPYVSLAVVYVLVFCFLFASAVENFGILARQRVQVLPFMLLLVALPTWSPSRARRPVHSARPRR